MFFLDSRFRGNDISLAYLDCRGPSGRGLVAWLIIYCIMVITSMVSSSCLTHYCTNVEKRLCHAVT
ncbi:hypothetical protein [Rickettsia endosymbiont of Orchestes rusci]|uniref:hypothetical protein n=1 Tax=Rickettsia endosymbiont of Orchestes rusci TaxID=3066250 RepID=UPI00313C58FF